MSEPKPYMPHVAFEMDRWRAHAKSLRIQADRLIAQAEIWDDAASKVEIALDREKRNAEGKNDG